MGDALGAERQAQAGEVGGFDPLRIRPYVSWEVTGANGGGSPAGPPPDPIPPQVAQVQVPVQMAPAGPLPDLADADDADTQELALVTVGRAGRRAEPPRRRALTGLMAGATAVAVAGTVAFTAGLFSGDGERERALPDSTRSATGVSIAPDAPSASASDSRSASASASASASPSLSASTTASASGEPSAAGSTAGTAPGGSRPGGPSSSLPPSTLLDSGTATEDSGGRSGRRTLSPGDSGAAVEELQRRLEQLRLYDGPFDGEYDEDVEEAVFRYQWARGIDRDPQGVYGRHTRRALEEETTEP
jgi:hypothetical protein